MTTPTPRLPPRPHRRNPTRGTSGPLTLLAAVALLGGGGLAAETREPPPELVTDRPDRTESAATVPRGFAQLETGVLLSSESDGDGELRSFEGGGTLLRLGVAEALELRFGWAGHLDSDGPGEASGPDGALDGELGAKLRLWREEGRRPQAALLVGVSIPAGASGLSSERYDPSVLLSLASTLDQRLSLGVNLGTRWESEEGAGSGRDTRSSLVYSAALGLGLTERLGAFAELFGAEPLDSPPGAPSDSAVSADAGLTWLVRPNVQLDLSAGSGLTDAAEDWFVGAGISLRWPR